MCIRDSINAEYMGTVLIAIGMKLIVVALLLLAFVLCAFAQVQEVQREAADESPSEDEILQKILQAQPALDANEEKALSCHIQTKKPCMVRSRIYNGRTIPGSIDC
eukprot:TRINITY_DN1818_c0_g1_i1.p1 TRINITY_DN1818_c0_g1~~TRINITY_DN1818_c0_g1_i1.p1  ORF type:complete len:106 (+),score=31.91 TRINITY_DN1818_c0_g1_i1:65-382(+)